MHACAWNSNCLTVARKGGCYHFLCPTEMVTWFFFPIISGDWHLISSFTAILFPTMIAQLLKERINVTFSYWCCVTSFSFKIKKRLCDIFHLVDWISLPDWYGTLGRCHAEVGLHHWCFRWTNCDKAERIQMRIWSSFNLQAVHTAMPFCIKHCICQPSSYHFWYQVQKGPCPIIRLQLGQADGYILSCLPWAIGL